MNAAKRINADRLLPIVRTLVALAVMTALAPPARAANPKPVDIIRLEQQLREAHYARIGVEAKTLVLVKPRVVPEGLAYERIPGFPRQRPAVVAGADWDSVAMPTNPIPWRQINRIETGYPNGSHAARNGALIGLLAGVVYGTVILATDDDPYSWAPLAAIGAVVSFPLLGAIIGSGFQTTRWEQVYPGSMSEKR